VCNLDLTRIAGGGEFPCPRCGALISPDDETEEKYSIMEPRMNSRGLEEIIIGCNRCTSVIHLTGFALLQNLLDENKVDPETKEIEETPIYFCHV